MWDFVKRALTNEYIEVLREQQMAKKNYKGSSWDHGFIFVLCLYVLVFQSPKQYEIQQMPSKPSSS